MSNREIAKLLEEAAQLLELQLENTFKIRAYEKGADALCAAETEVTQLIADNQPVAIEGIGKGIADHIKKVLESGTFPELETLRAEVPKGIVEISAIPGLGPKKVNHLWKELGITDLDRLARECEAGTLAKHKGYTAKLEQEILYHIKQFRINQTQLTLFKAEKLAEEIEQRLFIPNGIFDYERTGELRRCLPVIATWEWVIPMQDSERLFQLKDHLTDAVLTQEEEGSNTLSWKEKGFYAVKIHAVPIDEKYYHLFRTTANGVYQDLLKGIPRNITSEEAVFAQNNLPNLPPELRESEVGLQFPAETIQSVIKITDLKGTLHAHSTYSDGYHTLEQMALACMERGFNYLGITDHSQSAGYAQGLKPDRIRKQHLEIDELNAHIAPFKIFKGIESDILKDGSLDYETDVLASFDFIVASIHSQMNMNEGEATYRLIQAIKNPYTSILGHPTGRLLLRREGYPIDYQAVIDACAQYHVAIEINGNPYRMDLDWSWIKYATDKGVKIAVTSDAHSKTDLDYHLTAVKVARKGFLQPKDTLNALSADELTEWFKNQRAKKVSL